MIDNIQRLTEAARAFMNGGSHLGPCEKDPEGSCVIHAALYDKRKADLDRALQAVEPTTEPEVAS